MYVINNARKMLIQNNSYLETEMSGTFLPGRGLGTSCLIEKEADNHFKDL